MSDAIRLVTMAVPSTASAASAEPEKERKKIVLGEILVEGRRQKPQAFYILQRQVLNLGALDLKRSFVPLIHKSIDKKPF